MTCLSFTVHGPPVPWERTRGHGKVRYTPQRSREYKSLIARHAQQARLIYQRTMGKWPMDARYKLVLRVVFPDARRRDLDNVEKQFKDAMNQIIWNDDSQVDAHDCEKTIMPGEGWADVTVEVMG